MKFDLFRAVSDYPSMLNKIATFVFIIAMLLLGFIRNHIPAVEQFLAPYNYKIYLNNNWTIPIGTILPAFIIALLSRILKFHDRISDLFGIRQRFDVQNILYPMALAVSPNLFLTQIKLLNERRNELMVKVFYKYASGTSGKAVIDSHYITMALDQWSWYWIVLEGLTLTTITSLVLLFSGDAISSAILLIIVLAAGLTLLPMIIKLCARYALNEIEQIISDQNRKNEIERVFRAL
ncbi:MAG: hypothetical protein Q8L52_03885 [bacterium]|nr:hypothetical protein [bacterium]